MDYAGGGPVEIGSGVGGLAYAWMLGRRSQRELINFRPHNVSLVTLGTFMLWFGWIGEPFQLGLIDHIIYLRCQGSTRVLHSVPISVPPLRLGILASRLPWQERYGASWITGKLVSTSLRRVDILEMRFFREIHHGWILFRNDSRAGCCHAVVWNDTPLGINCPWLSYWCGLQLLD